MSGSSAVLVAAFLGEPLHHLLGEQRIAPGALGKRLQHVRPGARIAQQARDQLAGVGGSKGVEKHARRRASRGPPARTALEQLVSCHAHLQHRSAQPRREVLDQIEHALVGPMDVLPGKHERFALRNPLQTRPHRTEDALPDALRIIEILPLGQADAIGGLDTEQAREKLDPARDLVDAVVACEQWRQPRRELRPRDLGGIAVDDRALGAQHFAERPVDDA